MSFSVTFVCTPMHRHPFSVLSSDNVGAIIDKRGSGIHQVQQSVRQSGTTEDEFGFENLDWEAVAEQVDRMSQNTMTRDLRKGSKQGTNVHGNVDRMSQNTKINMTRDDLRKGSIKQGTNVHGNYWFNYADGTYSYYNKNGSIFITNK